MSTGQITTIAGTGESGYSGDGAEAVGARLDQPFHCALDGRGNLYVCDVGNHCIRMVDLSTGTISTVAGCGRPGYTGDGGPALQATTNEPYVVEAAGNGDLYIVDRLNAAIRKVDAGTGVITTVAGDGTAGYEADGGPGPRARMREPNDCFPDGAGGLLIADVQDQRVRRLGLATGIITTFAGTGRKVREGDGGPAEGASILGCRAVCVDGRGNTYICEREGNVVRRVDLRGVITTFVGTGENGYGGDGGPAREATFNGPKGVRCDDGGSIYVVDTENHAIRRVDVETGTISTVAGGHQGGDGDGGDATRAGLDRPHGCVVDARRNIYIADTNNHRVRMVSAA